MAAVKRAAENGYKDWKPCCVCGRKTPYVHEGKRYCVRNECQLVAAGMRAAPK